MRRVRHRHGIGAPANFVQFLITKLPSKHPPHTCYSLFLRLPSEAWNTPPGGVKKDGRILVLAAAIITGLRLARDPRAGCLTERVIDAVEDGLFLANQLYDKALLRYGQGNVDFRW